MNAWWGSFDLAMSASPAPRRASGDFIMRNAMDAQEVAVGWLVAGDRTTPGRLLRLYAPSRATSWAALQPAAAPSWESQAWAST